MPGPAGELLVATGLRKRFGPRGTSTPRWASRGRPVDRPAVDGVDLRVDRGATLGLVGESGSGKSTTARLVTRLLEPTEGEVVFEGTDITALSGRALRPVRRRLQIVFADADAALNPRRPAGAAIAVPLQVQRWGDDAAVQARVREMLDLVGLAGGLVDRYPHELSGGQRARVVLARALAPGPTLLVCDEPVASVDTSVRAQLINLFVDLRDSLGLGYLFISHDLAVVRHLADDVAVMFGGVVVETARRDDLFDHALHPYTHALLDAVPVPEPPDRSVRRGDVRDGRRRSPVGVGVPLGGCRYRGRCPRAETLCAEVDPPLLHLAPGHSVACHYPAERDQTR